jgi:site-specific recombinase XerD
LNATRNCFKPQGEELIPGSLRNVIQQLVEEIRGLNPVITNALHIRGSVILNWLKIHPKRQVQYMAGHKYISSTEKYASQEVEDLQDALAKYHPFG